MSLIKNLDSVLFFCFCFVSVVLCAYKSLGGLEDEAMYFQKVIMAGDHRAVALKSELRDELTHKEMSVLDLGPEEGEEAVDYPDQARILVQALQKDPNACGVLICGTGLGMSMAANRFLGMRAALCQDVETVTLARQHNNANILVLGAGAVDVGLAIQLLETFLTTAFEGGRHQRRVDKLDLLGN